MNAGDEVQRAVSEAVAALDALAVACNGLADPERAESAAAAIGWARVMVEEVELRAKGRPTG